MGFEQPTWSAIDIELVELCSQSSLQHVLAARRGAVGDSRQKKLDDGIDNARLIRTEVGHEIARR